MSKIIFAGMTATDLMCFLLLAAITGSGFTFVRYANESFEPFVLSVMRLIFALVLLLGSVGSKIVRDRSFVTHLRVRFTPMIIMKVGVVAFFNLALPYTLYAVILGSLPVGLVAILMSTSPMFSLVFSRLFIRTTRITTARAAGMAVGMLGIVLVSIYPLIHGEDAAGQGSNTSSSSSPSSSSSSASAKASSASKMASTPRSLLASGVAEPNLMPTLTAASVSMIEPRTVRGSESSRVFAADGIHGAGEPAGDAAGEGARVFAVHETSEPEEEIASWRRNVPLMIFVTLCASMGKALGAVLGAKFLKDCHPTGISLFQCIWTLLMCGTAAVITERDNLSQAFSVTNTMAWVGIGYLAVANSTLGPLLQFYLIARIGPSRQKTVSFVGPIFALIEGTILFAEWSHAPAVHIIAQVAGSAMILVGVYYVNRKPAAPVKPVQTSDALVSGENGDLATGLLVGSEDDDAALDPHAAEDPYATSGSFAAFYSTLLPDEFSEDPFPDTANEDADKRYMTSFDPEEFRKMNARRRMAHRADPRARVDSADSTSAGVERYNSL